MHGIHSKLLDVDLIFIHHYQNERALLWNSLNITSYLLHMKWPFRTLTGPYMKFLNCSLDISSPQPPTSKNISHRKTWHLFVKCGAKVPTMVCCKRVRVVVLICTYVFMKWYPEGPLHRVKCNPFHKCWLSSRGMYFTCLNSTLRHVALR